MTEEEFIEALKDKGISLTKEQLNQFERYYEVLVEWNEKMNLTNITEKKEVYLKHFYDSISLSFYEDLSKVNRLCDVGAGAGFPSIPLKICYPHLNVTIVDSLKKRITFLEYLKGELNLKELQFVHTRAEDIGRDKAYRESFDLVTARAVARTNVLSEYCLPLVKVNGKFIAMKGAQVEEELREAKNAINTLGAKVKDNISFTLPIEKSDRSIIIIEKKINTPKKYPRNPGIPQKKPL